jgi:3-phenylpropionate/trans-cinnamate dioxygenase ferredoxin reductase component
MTDGAVIIGAGQAGLQAAVDLRHGGYEAGITILGGEPAAPYQRPPLSKAYLLGKQGLHHLLLRKPEFFEAKGIALVTGTRVTEACRSDGRGGEVVTEDGARYSFKHLIITTGAEARRLSVPGAEAPNVFFMRTLDDADAVKAQLEGMGRVVVLGGGFIGLESAAVLNALGKNVTLVATRERLLTRVAGQDLSEFFLMVHRRRGIDIRLETGIEEIVTGDDGRATEVVLSTGDTLPVDAVVVGIGVERDRTLADQLGLEWDNGIVVDERSRTSRQDIYAAGDCAVYRHPHAPTAARRSIESVQNAVDQAKVAAAAICGDPNATYDTVPWFWSDQDSIKLQMAGLCEGADRSVLRGDPDTESFSVLHFRNGHFVAIDAVNRPKDFSVARKALAAGANIVDCDAARDPEIPLKELVI